MKKVILCLLFCSILVACEGDRGPMGPPGEPGINILGQTFEYDHIDFVYESQYNLWSALIDIPTGIEVYDSDAILVYRKSWISGTNGPIVTYSLIPQDFFVPNGTIEYVYNHTAADVELLIDGNFNLAYISPDFTDNQGFRFVVIPAEFANNPNVNLSTYKSLKATGIDFEEF